MYPAREFRIQGNAAAVVENLADKTSFVDIIASLISKGREKSASHHSSQRRGSVRHFAQKNFVFQYDFRKFYQIGFFRGPYEKPAARDPFSLTQTMKLMNPFSSVNRQDRSVTAASGKAARLKSFSNEKIIDRIQKEAVSQAKAKVIISPGTEIHAAVLPDVLDSACLRRFFLQPL